MYGDAGALTILGNCHHQLYYPPRDSLTAKHVSDMFGTSLQATRSVSHGRQGTTDGIRDQLQAALGIADVEALPYDAVLLFTHLYGRQYRLIAERLDPRKVFRYLPSALKKLSEQ